MLKLLQYRELGIDSPRQLFRAESTRRTLCLQLGNHVGVETVHKASVNCLDLDTIERRYLLSCDADGLVHIHDVHVTTGAPRCTYPRISSVDKKCSARHAQSAETVQWYTHDTGMFTSSGTDCKLKVWDTNTMTLACEFGFEGQVYSHHMSPVATRHYMVAVGARSAHIKLVDLKTGASCHSLRGHRSAAFAVRWSPSHEFLLATAGEDSRILFWDVRKATGSLMVLDQHNGDTSASSHSVNTAHNGRVNSLCFLPDGQHLLSFGTDETLRLWNTSTGRNTLVNYGYVSNDCRKSIKLSVSLDSSPSVVFVPSGADVDMYDVFGGEKLTTLRGHYSRVNCCAFNGDSHELFSAGNDRMVLVWVPDTDTFEAYARHLRGEDTREERTSKWASWVGRTERDTGSKVSRSGTADAWSSDED